MMSLKTVSFKSARSQSQSPVNDTDRLDLDIERWYCLWVSPYIESVGVLWAEVQVTAEHADYSQLVGWVDE